jgi:hypothetical protein
LAADPADHRPRHRRASRGQVAVSARPRPGRWCGRITFGQIRRARRIFKSRPAGIDPEADIRQILEVDDDVPEGFEVVSSFVFVGQGYLDLDAAAAAVRSAAVARTR